MSDATGRRIGRPCRSRRAGGADASFVDALLGSVVPGGKVVFVDYHRPHPRHPLKGVMSLIFDFLEPFAKSLWHADIADFAGARDDFAWSKQTYFGGLYQKTVALRR